MKDKIFKLWKSFKDWLIDKLGGFTVPEVDNICTLWLKDIGQLNEARIENFLLHTSIKTATAEVEVKNYGPYKDFDTLKGRARKDIVKQLGEAVYPYAHHFLGEDVYIVSINVQEADYEDCP